MLSGKYWSLIKLSNICPNCLHVAVNLFCCFFLSCLQYLRKLPILPIRFLLPLTLININNCPLINRSYMLLEIIRQHDRNSFRLKSYSYKLVIWRHFNGTRVVEFSKREWNVIEIVKHKRQYFKISGDFIYSVNISKKYAFILEPLRFTSNNYFLRLELLKNLLMLYILFYFTSIF